jgi:hypothetical protein
MEPKSAMFGRSAVQRSQTSLKENFSKLSQSCKRANELAQQGDGMGSGAIESHKKKQLYAQAVKELDIAEKALKAIEATPGGTARIGGSTAFIYFARGVNVFNILKDGLQTTLTGRWETCQGRYVLVSEKGVELALKILRGKVGDEYNNLSDLQILTRIKADAEEAVRRDPSEHQYTAFRDALDSHPLKDATRLRYQQGEGLNASIHPVSYTPPSHTASSGSRPAP